MPEGEAQLFRLLTRIQIVHEYIKQFSNSSYISLEPPDEAAREIIRAVGTGEDPYLVRDLAHDIEEFFKQPHQGGSSTRRRRRRNNHRRTQYTNKHKRSSSKTTKRATIKRGKSYRKHKHTVKRRTNRK